MRTRKATKPDSAEELHDPAEMRRVLASFRLSMGNTQTEMGSALGINQGQMSKILKGNFALPTGHALRLFAYAKKQLNQTDDSPIDREVIASQLTKKVLAAWDGTREGAAALGVMLDGATRLGTRRAGRQNE